MQYNRVIQFSGYSWRVKRHPALAGPGPNYFSDSDCNVWIDRQGRLHLKITRTDNRWQCAEVINTRSLGHGTYRFYLDSEVHNLDSRVVLGLFTWSDNPQYGYREIDIEFARFRGATGPNGFYTIRPHEQNAPQAAFQWIPNTPRSVHFFRWEPARLSFRSLRGHRPEQSGSGFVVAEWNYTGDRVPPPGDENPRMNLWLLNGQPPTDGREIEVIISRFEFVPLE